MNKGKSVIELAREVQRQAESKKDYLVPTRQIVMTDDSNVRFDVNENDTVTYPVTSYAHGQIADKLEIPRKYYEKMRETKPDLLSRNVNTWLENGNGSSQMIRTLDGNVRAFLSSRYRRLDNIDLMRYLLPVLKDYTDMEIVSCDITEKRLYVKMLFPKVQGEVTKGDVVQSGCVLSNSEIGAGSFSIQSLVYRLICLNGMIQPDNSLNKYHIGKNETSNVTHLLSDDTLKQSDKAFFMSVQDVLKASMNQDILAGNIARLQEAYAVPITAKKPERVIELTQKQFQLSDDIGSQMLQNLIQGNDYTKYGLSNAVTAVANTLTDYEESTRLETIGGQIIDLGKGEWQAINTD